jgi:hypothetical protein
MPVTPVRIRLGVRTTETETEKTMNEQPDVEVPQAVVSNGAMAVLVPIMDNLPTLPYHPLWAAWSEHVEQCSACAFVVHETEDQAREDLCWEGQTLNIGISKEIKKTAELAGWS